MSNRDGRSEPACAPLPTAPVMGLPFHRLDARELVGRFVEGAEAGSGGWIVTPNLDILRQYTATREARELILEADPPCGGRPADRVGIPRGAARRSPSGFQGATWS